MVAWGAPLIATRRLPLILVEGFAVDIGALGEVECNVNEIKVRTSRRIEAVDITKEVSRAVEGKKGTGALLFCLHTTCGLTVNENADPAVMKDVMDGLNKLAPADYPYRHEEGNSDAHIKSSLVGCSLMVPMSAEGIVLGTWQGIYLMEFDGPRERRVSISVI
jgi:secondary thiamine-phosphate synthase enzyme